MAHTVSREALVNGINSIESETVRAAVIAAVHPYSKLDSLVKTYKIDRGTLLAQRSRVCRGVYSTRQHRFEE
jgi:hypothetical protein